MSKFSKRAKFLSILAAASAVGGTGAGAMNKNKSVPAGFEVQNTLKFEKNLDLNANRNNLQVPKGSRFSMLKSIEPKSALIAAGGTVGLTWLLTHLFSGKQDKYTKECLDYFIEALKKNNINKIKVDTEYYALRLRFYSTIDNYKNGSWHNIV